MRFSKKLIFFFWLLFYFFLYIFFLKNFLIYTYLDYAEGEYLYQTYQFLEKGKKLYTNLFTPQPPLNYYLTALLMKIKNSALTFRFFAISVIFVVNFCLYLLVSKSFKSQTLGILVSSTAFFLPVVSARFNVYTPEIWQSLLSILIISALINQRSFPKNLFEVLIAFLISLAVFIKYTSFIFLFSTFMLLILIKKDYKAALKIFFLTLVFFLIGALFFYKLYGKNFINYTLIIRKAVPFKPKQIIVRSIITIFTLYGSFWILNLLAFLKEKNVKARLLLLFSLINAPIFYTSFITTTFAYVYLPFEPFVTIGAFYFLINSKRINKIIALFLLFCFLNFVYMFQSALFVYKRSLKNNIYEKTTLFAKKMVEKFSSKSEKIYAPQYIAYLSKRELVADFSDIYLLWVDYTYNQQKFSKERIRTFKKAIKQAKLPIILSDWRAPLFKEIYSLLQNSKKYKKVGKKGAFFLVPYEYVEIFIKKKPES